MAGAIVVEGGGMRGIFAAGVLDAFMDKNFFPFSLCVGVSAGACNLGSHLAGQYQRNLRVFTQLMTSDQFINVKKYLTGGHLMDIDWLWQAMDEHDPINAHNAMKNINSNNIDFRIVVTDKDTGSPLYLNPSEETFNTLLKGSSAVPVLFKNSVLLHDNRSVIDGGMSDAVPVVYALNRGYDAVLVIRSREKNYVKKDGIESIISSLIFRKNTALKSAVKNKSHNYMASVQKISEKNSDVFIHQITPENMATGRTTQDVNALKNDYSAGYQSALDFLASKESEYFGKKHCTILPPQ